MILDGDCLEVMQIFDDDTFTGMITDPPYGIKFMGKKWDYEIPKVGVWQEALRVMKPGAHALVACGTRTQHRMAVNLEDAGFEIRDLVAWVYGSGFTKSMDISKAIDKAAGVEREVIGNGVSGKPQSHNTHNMGNDIRNGGYEFGGEYDITAPATPAAKLWQGYGTALKPAVEMWTLVQKPFSAVNNNTILCQSREYARFAEKNLQHFQARLQKERVPIVPANAPIQQGGGVKNSTAIGKGEDSSAVLTDISQSMLEDVITNLNTISSWKQKLEDLSQRMNRSTILTGYDLTTDLKILNSLLLQLTQSTTIKEEYRVNGVSADVLSVENYLNALNLKLIGIHKLSALENAITNLSPNLELWTLCRKPLSEKTVSANVLKWGCGGINIDGCRVTMTPGDANKSLGNWKPKGYDLKNSVYEFGSKVITTKQNQQGRFPANLIHDGSEEVLAGFPDSKGQIARVGPEHGDKTSINCYGNYPPRNDCEPRGDSGSAARFFYCAKASKSERNLNGATNRHPTVKPIALMRYLTRLIKQPADNLILDPFCGSGSTIIGAELEGCECIGIEMDAVSANLARHRTRTTED